MEIYIGDIKKKKVVSQIPCFTTSSKDTQFEAGSESQINADELLEEEDIDSSDIYNFDKKLEEELSDQDF